MFRAFEPLVLPWARQLADDPGGAHSRLARVSRCLLVQGSEHWEAAEWWMVRKVEAVCFVRQLFFLVHQNIE